MFSADLVADRGIPTEATTVAAEHHDLAYFRRMIIVNTEKLSQLCEEWEQIKTQDTDMLQDKPDGTHYMSSWALFWSILNILKNCINKIDDCVFMTRYLFASIHFSRV